MNLTKFWQGKAVLITGASSGIGWALTEYLAPLGVTFCLLSRRKDNMEELANSLRETPSKFWLRRCDVRNRPAVFSAVQAFYAEHGALDVAWINSGVGVSSTNEDWRWDNIEEMLDTNLKGAIYTAQACLEIMVPRQTGVIAAIGSASAMRGLPGRGIYSVTKIGLEYFMTSKAAELPNIQFTVFHPGFVDTPINKGSSNRFWLLTPAAAAETMVKAVARGRRFVVFPKKMAMLFRIVRYLPYPLFHWVAKRTRTLSRASRRP